MCEKRVKSNVLTFIQMVCGATYKLKIDEIIEFA